MGTPLRALRGVSIAIGKGVEGGPGGVDERVGTRESAEDFCLRVVFLRGRRGAGEGGGER